MTTKLINKPKSKFKKCSFNDPFIYIKDDVLSEKFCKKVIQKFEDAKEKYPGLIGAGGTSFQGMRDEKIKTSIDLSVSSNPDWKKEDKVFYKTLNKEYNNYIKQLPKTSHSPLGIGNLVDSGYQIQRTDPGGFYIFHHDFEPDTVRYLTFIWYLNDIKNDGYTEFIDGTRIQPKAGRFLMFPSTWTYIHRGYPPKDEVKYICTGWMSLNTGS